MFDAVDCLVICWQGSQTFTQQINNPTLNHAIKTLLNTGSFWNSNICCATMTRPSGTVKRSWLCRVTRGHRNEFQLCMKMKIERAERAALHWGSTTLK